MENQNNFLTELETKVVDFIKNCDDYDEKPYVHIDDIQESTKIEKTSLRGVLSSLIQKGLLELQHDFFRKDDTIIFYHVK